MNLGRKKGNIAYRIISLWIYGLICLWAYGAINSLAYSNSWIDGTPDLIQRMQYLKPLGTKAPPFLAPDKNPPVVGEQKKFTAINFSGAPRPYIVDATCRAVGDRCYIFVEDKQWDNESVTYNSVLQLKRAFDESTPADPTKGIYELQSKNLGVPPDEIDRDPKIYILVLDILDNYRATGNYIGGYFDPMNQKAGVFQDFRTGLKFQSNEVELIYLDSNPLKAGSDLAKLILAHEFQHMIHWRYDPDEEIWVNEGCSDYAALLLCGYGDKYSQHVEDFQSSPNTSLVNWSNNMVGSLANYGASYLWMMYLHEQYGGTATISSLISNQLNGISGIDAVLASRGYSQRFNDVFSHWKIANLLDDTSFASGKYGYSSLKTKAKIKAKYSSFPVSKSFQLPCLGTDYLEFTGGNGISDLKIEFISRTYKFNVEIVMMKNGFPVSVESMSFDGLRGFISIPRFGDSVDTIFVIPHWFSNVLSDFNSLGQYSISAVLESEVNASIIILPNAIHGRYMDFIVQFDRVNKGFEGEDNQSPVTGVPRISIKRLGKTLVNEESMVSVTNMVNKDKAIFVYQFYIPYGWNDLEVLWNISYMGKSIDNGELGGKLRVER